MDILDALEDIKDANARSAKVDVDQLIRDKEAEAQRRIWDAAEGARQAAAQAAAEDEAAVAAVFGGEGRIRRVGDSPPAQDLGDGRGLEGVPSLGNATAGTVRGAGFTAILTADGPTAKRARTSGEDKAATAATKPKRNVLAGLVRKQPSATAALKVGGLPAPPKTEATEGSKAASAAANVLGLLGDYGAESSESE